GILPTEVGGRVLYAKTPDPDVDVILLRASDIPQFVEGGAADIGITGHDLIVDGEADVVELMDLEFGRASVVVAAREDSKIRAIAEIGSGTRVSTRFVNLTRRYFERIGKQVSVVKVSGAVEVMPHLGVADIIVDVMETGATLGIHRLRVIDTILETSARLIANKESVRGKAQKVEEVALALKSVVLARGKKLLMMNVPEGALRAVIKTLPAMSGPTLARVEAPTPMWEVYSVVDKEKVYRVINSVKRAGARDILVLPIERVVS
ncbi:MAG: ATP phosphoribosyltransferase, partial [Candidatus Bathyarchaeia archaeon]